MTLQLGDVAPDFTQESTQGPIRLHDRIGNEWALYSRIRRISCPSAPLTSARQRG
jgi:hypothetical protein